MFRVVTNPSDPIELQPETPAARRDRQLAWFRRLGELNMQAAETAAERIADAAAEGLDADTAGPTLDLARATRAVTQAVASENRVARGEDIEPPLRLPAFDPRRAPLRDALHKLAHAQADRAQRPAICARIDECIENELLLDPTGDVPIEQVLCTVGSAIGLAPDFKNLPDIVLGMVPLDFAPPRPEAYTHDQE